MVRKTRLIHCASNARQLDQGPHRRISIKASGSNVAAQTGRTYESNRSNPSRQMALAKGASTYESEPASFGNPFCQHGLGLPGSRLISKTGSTSDEDRYSVRQRNLSTPPSVTYEPSIHRRVIRPGNRSRQNNSRITAQRADCSQLSGCLAEICNGLPPQGHNLLSLLMDFLRRGPLA